VRPKREKKNILPTKEYTGALVEAHAHLTLIFVEAAATQNNECFSRMQEMAIARVSDDFYPRNPSSSHPHIAACAFNGFFMSAILHVSHFLTDHLVQTTALPTRT